MTVETTTALEEGLLETTLADTLDECLTLTLVVEQTMDGETDDGRQQDQDCQDPA